MSANLREAIEAAVDSQSEGGGGAPASTPPAQGGPAATVESSSPPASPASTPPPSDGDTTQPRDTSGKFAPKDQTQKQQAEAKSTAPAAPKGAAAAPGGAPPAGAAEQVKAPRSWSPALREMWNGLPADVQREVIKRERETSEALKGAAAHREVGETWGKVIAPYENTIRSQGGDPQTVVGNMLQVAAVLHSGAPAPKAQLLAKMVMQYGVPVEALDAALSAMMRGETAQPSGVSPGAFDSRAVEQLVQQAVDARLAPLRQAAQHRQAAMQGQVDREIEQFSDAHEFYEDLREDMADIIDLAAKRGVEVSLDDAYSRAAAMHPEISRVLGQRGAASAPAAKRAAAVQVTGAPNASSTSAPNTLRGAIEAAFDTASGR